MAGKFVDLKEAAGILGVTQEELVDMRSRGEIFGYRDGASWKFKIEEVERVASERSAAGKGSGVLGSSEDDFNDFLSDSGVSAATGGSESGDDSADSVLVSEDALGGSAIGKQSTVIGKDVRGKRPEDSDLKLSSEDTLSGGKPKASLSNNSLAQELAAESEVSDENYDLAGGSSLGLAETSQASEGSEEAKPGSGKGSDVLGDIQLAQPGSGTGVLAGGDESVDLDIAGSGAYGLSEDSLSLEGADDSISLDASEMKKAPGTGSDVTYSPGDSGINLRSPSDSGLSLDEEPLELGGSGIDQLELSEEDDVIALEEEADPELATQLKADEAFSLSPAALDAGGDDESDSGSQVIALEDSSAFDQNAATMLNQGAPLMAEGAFTEVAMPGLDAGGFAPGMMGGPMPGMQPQAYMAPQPVEAPYSVWNVLGLMSTAGVLAIAGMLMWDVMLNLWSFDSGTTISTSLMDSIVKAVGLSQ